MKKLKRFLCLGMAALSMLSISVSASAASTYDSSGDEVIEDIAETNFVLISEEEVELEDEMLADVRIFAEDGYEMFSVNNSGQQKYKCLADFRNSVGQIVVSLWVEGTFHWDSAANTATVEKEVNYGVSYLNPSFSYENQSSSHGSDQGGLLWGKKYAYVDYTYVYKNNTGKKNTCKLSLNVNVEGTPGYTTSPTTKDVDIVPTTKDVNIEV